MTSSRSCIHCGDGPLTLDRELGVCACESCGRVDEEFLQLEDAAENEGFEFVAQEGTLSSQLVRERTWINTVDEVASQLRLPHRVIFETKALVRERLELPGSKKVPKKVVCSALLAAVCRTMHVPLSLAEAAAASGLSLKAFGRSYRSLLVEMSLEVPSMSLKNFLYRLWEDLIDDMKGMGRGRGFSERSYQAFKNESLSFLELVVDAELHRLISNPVLLSGVILYVGWLLSSCKVCDKDMKQCICRKFRLEVKRFDRAFGLLRQHLLREASMIPGAMPTMNVRNVLKFVPTFRNYQRNLSAVQKRLQGASQESEVTSVPSHGQRTTQSKRKRMHTSLSEELRGRMRSKRSRTIAIFQSFVCQNSSRDLTRQESRGFKETKKEKRKRGFDRFVQTANNRRQLQGRPTLHAFHPPSSIMMGAQTVGYHTSMSFKRSTGDLAEIRKGRHNWHRLQSPHRLKPASKKRPPCDQTAAPVSLRPDVESEAESEEIDADVEQYILKPHEVLMRQFCQKL